MKKLLALFLATLLCCSAAGALAGTRTEAGLFTIAYDDAYTLLTPEDLEDASATEEGTRWLFALQQENTIIEVTLDEVPEEYQHLDLATASQEERQNYVDAFVDTFASEYASLLVTLTIPEGDIPFYVYSLQDSDGWYYLAQTITNGQALDFYAYYEDGTDGDDALLEQLELIVQSFVPQK